MPSQEYRLLSMSVLLKLDVQTRMAVFDRLDPNAKVGPGPINLSLNCVMIASASEIAFRRCSPISASGILAEIKVNLESGAHLRQVQVLGDLGLAAV